MAMAIAPLMQMAMDPRVQKTTKSVIKYLLIFGGVGVAILLFIFMGKKFDPVKKIQDWFKKAFGGGLLGTISKSIGGIFGTGKIGGVDVQKITKAVQGSAVKSTAILKKSKAEKRRKFKRLSKITARKVGMIAKNKRIQPAVRRRASVMKTTLRRVQKKKTRKIAKRFVSVFKRRKRKSKKKKKKGWF